MSNLWINWRFGCYHLQIGRDRPWIALRFNPYHVANPPAKWFERL